MNQCKESAHSVNLSVASCAPGQVVMVAVQPVYTFRPRSLKVEREAAFDLLNGRVGVVTQLPWYFGPRSWGSEHPGISAARFNDLHEAAIVIPFDVVRLGMLFTLTVVNRGSETVPFEATLYGWAIE